MIKIPSSVLRHIYDHMEASYPHECCGLMIGQFQSSQRVVHTFRKCRNLNTERAHDRYEMDPLCQLRAQQEFANTDLEIVGIYHSHPDHPSRASQTDTDRAFAGYSYVIVSVQNGKVASAQSWDLNEAEKKFYEEPLVIEADAEGDRK
jgi:proteasome lid subunit RPN8/RPN11